MLVGGTQFVQSNYVNLKIDGGIDIIGSKFAVVFILAQRDPNKLNPDWCWVSTAVFYIGRACVM